MADVRGLVIVGAGGFGREVWFIVRDAQRAGLLTCQVVGFADSQRDAPGAEGLPVDVLGDVDDIDWGSDLGAVVAVGDPAIRAELRSRLSLLNVPLVTVVHPTALVADDAVVGAGAVIAPFAWVSTHSDVGTNVVVNGHSLIGHHSAVGNDSVVSPHVSVSGHALVGERVLLGTHVTVNPGVSVGANCRVASGAVIARDVVPNSLAAGVPATSRVMYASND